MAKLKVAPVKSEKKVLREQIEKKLQKTFSPLKKTVGKKKFDDHVKKASKVLVKGFTKKPKVIKKAESKLPA